MLTDLKDRLRDVGPLDALNLFGERAFSYYDTYLISAYTNDTLGHYAHAYNC